MDNMYEQYLNEVPGRKELLRFGVGVSYPAMDRVAVQNAMEEELAHCQEFHTDSASYFGCLRDLYGLVLTKEHTLGESYVPSKQDREVFHRMAYAFEHIDCPFPNQPDVAQFVSPTDFAKDVRESVASSYGLGNSTSLQYDIFVNLLSEDGKSTEYQALSGGRYVKPTVELLSDPDYREEFSPMWIAMLDYQTEYRSPDKEQFSALSVSRHVWEANRKYAYSLGEIMTNLSEGNEVIWRERDTMHREEQDYQNATEMYQADIHRYEEDITKYESISESERTNEAKDNLRMAMEGRAFMEEVLSGIPAPDFEGHAKREKELQRDEAELYETTLKKGSDASVEVMIQVNRFGSKMQDFMDDRVVALQKNGNSQKSAMHLDEFCTAPDTASVRDRNFGE